MDVFDIIGELKTFYIEGVPYRDLDRHLTEADVLRWSAARGLSRRRVAHPSTTPKARVPYPSRFCEGWDVNRSHHRFFALPRQM
jgi:hypothetical protein